MELKEIIIIIAVMVLLPIIPAFLLFKFLPSDASADGLFKGFKIKLGGAFAGYFLVLFLLVDFCSKFLPDKSSYEMWRTEGLIQLSDGYRDVKTDTDILILPPDPQIYSDGKFMVKSILLPMKKGIDTTALVIQKKGYNPKTIYLQQEKPENKEDDYQIEPLWKKKIIRIHRPIMLERITQEQEKNKLDYSLDNASKVEPIREGEK